jgi:ABC-type Fe3+ transport system permease subunit
MAHLEPSRILRAPLTGSILWSSLAASASVALAWSLAWLARRSTAWRIATLAAFTLALATPGPIVGLALKLAYGGLPLANRTPFLLVLGLIVRSLPYALALLGPVLWSWPLGWEEESRLAGLGTWRQAWKLALPLTVAALAVAWLFAFVFSLGELPASYLTYAPGYDLVSLLVWSLLHMGVESRLAAIGLLLLALLAVPAGATLLILHRGTLSDGAGSV